MDKASIVGDAVRYVKELQTQAKMLRDEIEGLEASYQASSTNNNFNNNAFNFKFNQPIPKNILQVIFIILAPNTNFHNDDVL